MEVLRPLQSNTPLPSLPAHCLRHQAYSNQPWNFLASSSQDRVPIHGSLVPGQVVELGQLQLGLGRQPP